MGRLRFLRLVHAALFGLAVVGAVLDLGGLSFIGPTLASGLSYSLVGLLLGMAFLRQGRPGRRAMLLAADGAILIVALSAVGFALADRPEQVTPVAVVLAIAAAGALVVVLTASVPPCDAGVVRSGGHRALLVAMVVLSVVSTVVPALSTGVLSGSYLLSLVGGFVPPLLVGIVAWWFGSGWLLALIGLSTLGALTNYAIVLGSGAVLTTSSLLAIISVVAGLRPPRVEVMPHAEAANAAATDDVETDTGPGLVPISVSNAPDTTPEPGAAPASTRPTAAAVWAALGGALFLPSVYLGRFPPVLIDCFDCPPPSPLAGPSIWVDIVVALLVPLAAVVLAAAPTSRPVANGSVAIVALVGVALILVQVGLGLAGTSPFEYLPAAAPASVLVAVGFLAAVVRPPWLAGTGRIAAVASGLAALVWMFVSIAGSFAIDLPLAKVMGLVTGATLLVALAHEAAAEPGRAGWDGQLPVHIPR